MSCDTSPIRHSFVVRIWSRENRAEWQGWVQHVGTGESAAVRTMSELVAFIQARIEQETLNASGLR